MNVRELFVVPGVGNPAWYAGGSRFGELLWTAGQVPARPDGTMPELFVDQVELTLDNLEATLRHMGGSMETLLKVNAYLSSLDDFDAYNEVYTRRLSAHGLPPRTTVEVARFPPPMKIEIEAVAHVAAETE